MTKWIPVAVVAATALAHADPASELRAIAAKRIPKDTTSISPVDGARCTAVTQAERADLTTRVLAWIDSKHPDERGAITTGSIELEVNVGCKDTTGAVVLDVS